MVAYPLLRRGGDIGVVSALQRKAVRLVVTDLLEFNRHVLCGHEEPGSTVQTAASAARRTTRCEDAYDRPRQ